MTSDTVSPLFSVHVLVIGNVQPKLLKVLLLNVAVVKIGAPEVYVTGKASRPKLFPDPKRTTSPLVDAAVCVPFANWSVPADLAAVHRLDDSCTGEAAVPVPEFIPDNDTVPK